MRTPAAQRALAILAPAPATAPPALAAIADDMAAAQAAGGLDGIHAALREARRLAAVTDHYSVLGLASGASTDEVFLSNGRPLPFQ